MNPSELPLPLTHKVVKGTKPTDLHRVFTTINLTCVQCIDPYYSGESLDRIFVEAKLAAAHRMHSLVYANRSREAWLALLSIEDSCECVSTNRPDVDSCPFCGSIPHVYKSRKVYKVECPCINNRVTRYKNAAFDPIKWNSRPIEDNQWVDCEVAMPIFNAGYDAGKAAK